MIELPVKTTKRNELVEITSDLAQLLADSHLDTGHLICYVPHTTAGITINENADPDVSRDILDKLERLIPQADAYHHAEGNSDAHLKASLMGSSLIVLFEEGRLLLGTWQGVYFCEFDGPRNRRLMVKICPGG